MFKSFKKSLVTLLIAVTLTSGVAIPRNSQAAIVLMSAGVAFPIFVSVMIGGVAIAAVTRLFPGPPERIGAMVLGMGIFMLDAKNPNGPSFKELTPEAVTKLEIEEAQAVVYNSEVNEVNAIGESIVNQLALEKFETSEAVVSRAKELWSSHSQNLSSETIAVLEKIVNLSVDSAK